MSVLVKGIDMPTHCDLCDFIIWDSNAGEDRCFFTGNYTSANYDLIHGNCPLAPVPTPHGRLGDIDAIATDIYSKEERAVAEYNQNPDDEYLEGIKDGLHMAAKCLSVAPTIIEAEEGE